MRYFAMLLMLLSVGMFTVGCGEAEKKGTGTKVEKKETPEKTTPEKTTTPDPADEPTPE